MGYFLVIARQRDKPVSLGFGFSQVERIAPALAVDYFDTALLPPMPTM